MLPHGDHRIYFFSNIQTKERKKNGRTKRSHHHEGQSPDFAGQGTQTRGGAPDIELVANDLSPVKLSSYRGKVCVISAVPSLDTPICDMETRRFNQEAAKLSDDAVVQLVREVADEPDYAAVLDALSKLL